MVHRGGGLEVVLEHHVVRAVDDADGVDRQALELIGGVAPELRDIRIGVDDEPDVDAVLVLECGRDVEGDGPEAVAVVAAHPVIAVDARDGPVPVLAVVGGAGAGGRDVGPGVVVQGELDAGVVRIRAGQVPLHVDLDVEGAVGPSQVERPLQGPIHVVGVRAASTGCVTAAVPSAVLDPVVVEVEVVQEPPRPLVGCIGVGPDVEPELNLAGVADIRYRRHRDVAVDPAALNRGGEHRDCPGGGALWGRGVGRHGARVAAVRSDVGPVGPAVGVDPVLDPGPVAAAGGGAVEMVPVVESQVVAVDSRFFGDIDLRQQEVPRDPCWHRRAGHSSYGDYAFGGGCRDHPVGHRLLVTVDCPSQTGEGGRLPEFVLMAEICLSGDFVGVQLIVAVEVQARLHQIAGVGAVRTGGHREVIEQEVHCSAIHHLVAEVLGPQHLVAV